MSVGLAENSNDDDYADFSWVILIDCIPKIISLIEIDCRNEIFHVTYTSHSI